ncbi:MAG: hypothetical protein ISR65_06085 [Bacteriovoracaceae bacterium]|nr:hypothetical protein [Bacteriovoracaceae bacterium]
MLFKIILVGTIIFFSNFAFSSEVCVSALKSFASELEVNPIEKVLQTATHRYKNFASVGKHHKTLVKESRNNNPSLSWILGSDSFWKTLSRSLKNASTPYTKETLDILADSQVSTGIFQTSFVISSIFSSFSKIYNVMAIDSFKYIKPWLSGEGYQWQLSGQSTKTKAVRIFQGLYNRPFRFLAPLITPRIENPVSALFAKIFHNPHYKISQKERQILIENNTLEQFKKRRKFLLQYPRFRLFRKGVGTTGSVALGASGLMILNHGVQVFKNGIMSKDQFKKSKKYDLKDHQVRLIIETTPFPHASIQIGRSVYSYGVKQLSSSPVSFFLANNSEKKILTQGNEQVEGLNLEIIEQASIQYWDHYFSETQIPKDENLGKQVLQRGITDLAKLTQSIIDKAPRSLFMVTLNLQMEQVDELVRHFEMSKIKMYKNKTLVNDCMTMITRPLAKFVGIDFLPYFDASPGQIMTYFSLIKSLQDWGPLDSSQVEDVIQVNVDEVSNDLLIMLRNMEISLLEARAFIAVAPIFAPRRLALSLQYKEEQLQYWNKTQYQNLLNLMDQFKNDLENDPQLSAAMSMLDGLTLSQQNCGQLAPFKALALNIINNKEEELLKKANYKRARFFDVVFASSGLDYLGKKKSEINQLCRPK